MRFLRAVANLAGWGILLGMAGCGTGEWQPGTELSRYFSQEVSEMGTSTSGIFDGTGVTQGTAKAVAETVTVDWTVARYRFDAGINGYVRQGAVTTSEGYTRVREDTIYVYHDGAKVPYASMADLDSVVHLRHARHDRNGSLTDINVNTVLTIAMGADTVGTWNGAITGDYDGERLGTGEISGVTRAYNSAEHHWEFPSAGTIVADFPRFAYDIAFLGGNSAEATVTNKLRDKTTVINFTYTEE